MFKNYRVKVTYIDHGKEKSVEHDVKAANEDSAKTQAVSWTKAGKSSNEYWNYKAFVRWSS